MAPSQKANARKRKAPAGAGRVTKRTRALASTAAPTVARSNSSTPNASQARDSPVASSSLVESQEDVESPSSSTISEMPDFDSLPRIPTRTIPAGRQNQVGGFYSMERRALLGKTPEESEPWRNAGQIVRDGLNEDPSPESHPKTFLGLPRELRDQIYRELYIHDSAIAIKQPKFHVAVTSTPLFPLALSRTSKQMRKECLEIFIAENTFILDLNILSAIDWLASLSADMKGSFSSISLGKCIMTGYVRYDLGLFDSSRLRSDLVKRLVYDLNLKTISLEVPDEHNPNANANGINGNGGPNAPNWFPLPFHPRHDYSWSLLREMIDVLLESGFDTLRLLYNTALASKEPSNLLSLYAVTRILYLDDEFEVETQVKRIEMARQAGKRDEFASKTDVEKYVRSRRQTRRFCLGYGKNKTWELGSVVVVKRPGEGGGRLSTSPHVTFPKEMWEVSELLKMPGSAEKMAGRDL